MSRASPVPSHRLCLLRSSSPEPPSPRQGLWDTRGTLGGLHPGRLSPQGLPLQDLHAEPVVRLPLPLELRGPAHTVIAHALWPAAWPSSHSVSVVIATPILCSVFCIVYLLLKDWGPGPRHLFSCPSRVLEGPTVQQHPTGLWGPGGVPMAAAGEAVLGGGGHRPPAPVLPECHTTPALLCHP